MYDTFEHLVDDIRAVQPKIKVKKKFVDKLPKNLRKEAKGYIFSDEEIELILQYLEQPRSMFRPPEHSIDLKEHLKYIRGQIDKIQNENDTILKKALRKAAEEEANVDLLYDENNVMVFRAANAMFIRNYGSQRWCIVYSDNYFKSYVRPKSGYTQFIIFNFNYNQREPLFKIGISLLPHPWSTPMPGGCQNSINESVNLNQIIKDFGIPSGLITPYKYTTEELKIHTAINSFVFSGRISQRFFLLNKDWLLKSADAFIGATKYKNQFKLFI